VRIGGDLAVNRIGLGARWLGARGEEEARRLLQRAVELGVNLIDTADVYGAGQSETLIRRSLFPYPEGLVIATKGGQVARDGPPGADGSPEHLRTACEASLRRLELDAIDLYQLHHPDPAVPLAESVGALLDLRDEGKIKHIGLSNVFRQPLEAALDSWPIASVQNLFSLADQRDAIDVDACAQAEVVFMPYFPLAAGAIAEVSESVRPVAQVHGATEAQVALAWLLQRSPTMTPIPGTSSVEHLEENVAAARLHLTEDEMKALDEGNAG
jgi:aryl-alcohol dehydrogenase-like predicted oxidoreductase